MPNNDLAKKYIEDSGMTVVAICEKSGISRANLYNRLSGKGQWTASEIVGFQRALRLTNEQRDEIFLT